MRETSEQPDVATFPGRTVSQAVDPCHQVISAGGSVVSDVFPLTLVTIVHGFPQTVR